MSLVDLLFPKKCLGCGASGLFICKECKSRIKPAKQRCIECQKQSIDGFTHVGCVRPLGLEGSMSAFEYSGVTKKAVKNLKYRFVKDLAEELSDLLLLHLKNNITALPKNCVLVPVPLHKKRLRWRGFNQSEELGKIVSKKMGWKFISDYVVRIKNTPPQAELKGDNRKNNVRGVFVNNLKLNKLEFNDKSLIIFDDVITTGSTIKEICKVIKRKNKNLKIWGLSVAR